MRKHFYLTLMAGTAALLSLSACEKTKEQFDFSKKPPDEFAVVKRAPLEMPPDYTLRPPSPGAPRPQELTPTEEARAAVTGKAPTRNNAGEAVTKGEALLLQKTGATTADPSIRAVVDRETAEIVDEEKTGLDKIKEAVGQDVKDPAHVVKPADELQRIKSGDAKAPTPSKKSK